MIPVASADVSKTEIFVLFLPVHESSIHILVSVNNGRQVNLARINLRLEFRRNPAIP
jgi:hypothetical protein